MDHIQITDGHRVKCAPTDTAFYRDPYPSYEFIRGHSDRFWWQDYNHWCFAGWKDVSALLRDKRFGRQILHVATRQELGMPPPLAHSKNFDETEAYSLLAIEPPTHTRLRTLINRAFVSRQIEQMRPRIEQLTHELVDKIETKDQAELLSEFCTPIPLLIIADMLGVPREMSDQLLRWSHDLVAMYMYGRTYETEVQADKSAIEFSDYVKKLAAEKRKTGGDDLICHMLETEHKGQKISESELVSTVILLLNAGHEATVHQMGNAIKTILETDSINPKTLFDSEQSTAATVEESLRFDAPLHMFTRYALEDVELSDTIKLKKGDEIGLMLGAANRDPTRFANSDQFDPTRQDQGNVSFGAGIHFCIGAPLARLEMQSALKILFDRLPNLGLIAPANYRAVYHFHGLDQLKVSHN